MDPARMPAALADLSTGRSLAPRGDRALPPRISASAHRHLLLQRLLQASERADA